VSESLFLGAEEYRDFKMNPASQDVPFSKGIYYASQDSYYTMHLEMENRNHFEMNSLEIHSLEIHSLRSVIIK